VTTTRRDTAKRVGIDAKTCGDDGDLEVPALEHSMSGVNGTSTDQDVVDQDLDERVRVRAYLMWEADGRPYEAADLYWHRARERMEAETHSAYPPVQSTKHRS
jgi:hypothetical protein